MNDDAPIAWSETPHCALLVSGDQLPLLRDIVTSQPVALFLNDTSESALLEDAWKPWARRLRPLLKQRSGKLVICAPACIFPDPNNHAHIRASLAQQLQAVCDVAVTLDANAVFLPIEAALPIFASRIHHYVTLLHERVYAQQMELIIHAGAGSDATALREMLDAYVPAIQLCSHTIGEGTLYWANADDISTYAPVTLLGPFTDASNCRAAWQRWQDAQIAPSPEATTEDTPPPAQTAEDERHDDPPSASSA